MIRQLGWAKFLLIIVLGLAAGVAYGWLLHVYDIHAMWATFAPTVGVFICILVFEYLGKSKD
tara:strand:+ start:3319 stop:3504 length:186 start_codon:yes stop_codon:yes gene_type:complete